MFSIGKDGGGGGGDDVRRGGDAEGDMRGDGSMPAMGDERARGNVSMPVTGVEGQLVRRM